MATLSTRSVFLRDLKFFSKAASIFWVIGFFSAVSSFAAEPIPKSGTIWIDQRSGIEFVWVPAGCYQMGCGSWATECDDLFHLDEKPVHRVCVSGFWLSRYEVTQGQWTRVMKTNPSKFKKGANYPVESVTWVQAKEFLKKLDVANKTHKFRLPTEAEWEYACRSGGKPHDLAGDAPIDQLAWYGKNSNGSTHPVGTKASNDLGIYDMSGNVYEWGEDSWKEDAYKKHQQDNPVIENGDDIKIVRGGGWPYSSFSVRCTNRSQGPANNTGPHVGFRVLAIELDGTDRKLKGNK